MTTETKLGTTASDYVFRKIGFEPHGDQWPIILCKKRFEAVSGGGQAGKSMVASKVLLMRMLDDPSPGLYWLVGADYERTRPEFDYLVQDFGRLGLLKKATKVVNPGAIELVDGTRIETKSAKDPRTIAMRSPNGILLCEGSQLDLITFNRCMNERLGPSRGWMVASGTLEGSLGWYPGIITGWMSGADDRQSFVLATGSNTTLFPGGREDPEILRIERDSSDDFFMERIAGRPVPPAGLVFHEFRADLHVKNLKWSVGEPVYMWEDPGYGSDSAHALEIAQIIDGQVQVFDEIFERGLVTDEIIDIAMKRPWWKEESKFLVSDPHYRSQHHSMTSVEEQWLSRTGIVAQGDKIRINEGTERLKGFLKPDPITREPKIVFDPRCAGILSEFGAVSSPFDGQTRVYKWKTDKDGNIVGETPDDHNNHGIKAVIYGIISEFGYAIASNRGIIPMKLW